MHFLACPKQGLEMEAVVLHRVGFLAYFCPKLGQEPSAAPLYPNMGQVPPGSHFRDEVQVKVRNPGPKIIMLLA